MPRDPALRPFRTATLAAFVVFAALYVGLVVRGIVLSLLHQGALAAGASAQAACTSTVEACGASLAGLRRELDSKLVAAEVSGTAAERLWDDWESDWERRLQRARSECCLGEADRAPLARAAADLAKLARLYTVETARFAREVGPQLERSDADLDILDLRDTTGPRPPASPAPRSSPDHP